MKPSRESNELVRTSSETDAAGVESANMVATVSIHWMMPPALKCIKAINEPYK
jgi:hypothetical protein